MKLARRPVHRLTSLPNCDDLEQALLNRFTAGSGGRVYRSIVVIFTTTIAVPHAPEPSRSLASSKRTARIAHSLPLFAAIRHAMTAFGLNVPVLAKSV